MKRIILTEAEIERAKTMREYGNHWSHIGEAFGYDPETVRRQVDPGYREMRAKQIAATRRGPDASFINPKVASRKVEISAEVLEAQRIYLNAPRSLTALLMGDPPPGFSALDRRRA